MTETPSGRHDHGRKPDASRPRPRHQGTPQRSGARGTWTNDRARSAAANHVTALARRFPDLPLFEFDATGLPPRDAAFARAICGIVTRRWLTLTFLLEQGLNRPFRDMHPEIQAALLTGAAQVAFLDRVPAHAAVNEAVNWTRNTAGKRAAGLVNAALRRLTELIGADIGRTRRDAWNDRPDEIPLDSGEALQLTRPILPTDPIRRIAAATSCPETLLRTWTRDFSMPEMRRLALHGIAPPPVILNTAHATSPLPDTLTPHTVPGHHLFLASHEDLAALARDRTDIWVQDPASSLAVGSITDLLPRTILDTCAGLGTKTRQLRAAFPEANIIATDIDTVRFRTLRRLFENDDHVTTIPHTRLIEHAGTADLVLLDVPCSNTGVLARRPEARYRYGNERRDQLTVMQRQIIADTIPLLRDEAGNRGRILYSTCSLDPAENEEQARWAGRWHDFDLSRERRRRPEGGPGEPPERYSDGAYAMLLTR